MLSLDKENFRIDFPLINDYQIFEFLSLIHFYVLRAIFDHKFVFAFAQIRNELILKA